MIQNVNTLALRLLKFYLWFRFRAGFHQVFIDISAVEEKLNPDMPVIYIPNHTSWWDGFFILKLHQKLQIQYPLRMIMLEQELRKFPFFKRCGAVGIDPENRRQTNEIFLKLKNEYVCFFPQGKMSPQNQRPLVFKKGIEHLLETVGPVQIVLVAIVIEPLKNPKPTALVKTELIPPSLTSMTHFQLAQRLESLVNEVANQWAQKLLDSKVAP